MTYKSRLVFVFWKTFGKRLGLWALLLLFVRFSSSLDVVASITAEAKRNQQSTQGKKQEPPSILRSWNSASYSSATCSQ